VRVAHLIRKPISEGSVGRNVLEHGAGGINIDATRVGAPKGQESKWGEGKQSLIRSVYGDWGYVGYQPHTEGRWPANLILIHDSECLMTGTRKAPGYTINAWTDGAKPFGGGAGHPYESTETGETTEEVWECVEGCPVRELDGQSGTGKSMPRVGWGGQHSDSVERGFSDAGGASRFFKQVKP